MATFRCAQARDAKYPSDCSGRAWPFGRISSNLPDTAFQDPELHPFWVQIFSFLGNELVLHDNGGHIIRRTGTNANNAAETNRVITLLSLCLFFWEDRDVAHPGEHSTENLQFYNIIRNLPDFVSSLTKGTPGAQRSYSAAIALISLALERAVTDVHRYKAKLSPLLAPLVRITDDTATVTAQRVLCSPLWLSYISAKSPPRWLENQVLAQIMAAAELKQFLEDNVFELPKRGLSHHVATFTGIDSNIQVQLAQALKQYLLNRHLPDIKSKAENSISWVFRLLATVDDPKAVLQVQRVLGEFLLTASRSPDVEPMQHETDLEAAREALGQLEVTARKPEFIYNALSLLDYP
ncbi:hypothetical protein C8J56DRAFT_948423 [Mycena floridula]|nr:hypothetical protein C8J56DRAFT_948423 [Mycena floridula]